MACYLITGATGFLGRHLLAELGAAGHTAWAQVEQAERWEAWDWARSAPARCWVAPLAQAGSWPLEALGPVAGIFHLAGVVHHSRSPHPHLWPVNVEATLSVVRLGHQLGVPVVVASTSGVVGCSPDPAAAPEEDAPYAEAEVGRWPYYHSKIVAERRARALAARLGVRLVLLRPPVLLGPGDHRRRSTRVVANFLAGQLPVVPPGGMHFTDVRDVARAALAAMAHPRPPPVVHLPGHAMGLGPFFARLAHLAGRPAPRWAPPGGLLMALKRLEEGWVALAGGGRGWLPDRVVLEMACRHWGLGSAHAAELGYRARPADLTLAETLADLGAAGHPAGPAGAAAA